jgi:hypothetical protein
VRSVPFVSVVATALVLAVSSSAAASPHATARALLLKCENAFATLYVGPIEANTPQVPIANRAAQRVYDTCSATGPMLDLWGKHPHDKAIYDAYRAYVDLALGSGDYMTYCGNVAFEHTGQGILHQAEREIANGHALAKRALAEL